jgi:pimeloyl-ACP methyl ester carboxylesterase
VALLGGAVEVVVTQAGEGPPMLLLHGGAGPASMRPLLPFLGDYRCVLPAHPGFDETPRPAWLASICDLALCYLALLDVLGLRQVIVAGNSAGGWIAAEMAARRPSALNGIVLMNSVGLAPTQETGPIVNPMNLAPADLLKLSFADPGKAQAPTPEAVQQRLANQRVLNVYAGEPFMHDPALAGRLGSIAVPALVLCGSHDRIVMPAYGQAFAGMIPGAAFELVSEAGHLPQVEQPERVAAMLKSFVLGIRKT